MSRILLDGHRDCGLLISCDAVATVSCAAHCSAARISDQHASVIGTHWGSARIGAQQTDGAMLPRELDGVWGNWSSQANVPASVSGGERMGLRVRLFASPGIAGCRRGDIGGIAFDQGCLVRIAVDLLQCANRPI